MKISFFAHFSDLLFFVRSHFSKVLKTHLYLFFIIITSVSFLNCSGETSEEEEQPITEEDKKREEEQRKEQEERKKRTSCTNSGNDVRLNPLEEITSRNAGAYRISGYCDTTNSNPITISYQGNERELKCQTSSWSSEEDLTGILKDDEEITIKVSQGSDSACAKISNSFICPSNYIGVSQIQNFTNYDFCVMEYEASEKDSRDDNISKPESKKGATPWTSLSFPNAQNLCRSIGTGYNLIRNDEWQTIARHIEAQKRNWTIGEVSLIEGNFLNNGSTSNTSSRDINLDLKQDDWELGNRSHYLLNNILIWDFSGGVWEMVRDRVSELNIPSGGDQDIGLLTGELKELFGSDLDYSSLGDARIGGRLTIAGLGKALLKSRESGIARGGSSRKDPGVFSVSSDYEYNDSRGERDLGFRCVYYP